MKLEVIKSQEVLGKEFKIYGTFENPLFLAKDVAEWIDYSKDSRTGAYKVSQMISTIDEDEKSNDYILDIAKGGKNPWFLTEDGLYEVLMQSRKPIAKSFKKEVKKILKSIRTGELQLNSYQIECPAERARRWAEEYEEKQKALETVVKQEREIEDKNFTIDVLQSEARTVDDRAAVNQLVRCIAINQRNGNFGEAWRMFYSGFNAKYGTNLKARQKSKGAKSVLDIMSPTELEAAVRILTAYCERHDIDYKSLLTWAE